MRPPWECNNQSQDTNWRHCVTRQELPFCHKRKGVLKIDQSLKMSWHRHSMGVASSCSSAPVIASLISHPCTINQIFHISFHNHKIGAIFQMLTFNWRFRCRCNRYYFKSILVLVLTKAAPAFFVKCLFFSPFFWLFNRFGYLNQSGKYHIKIATFHYT